LPAIAITIDGEASGTTIHTTDAISVSQLNATKETAYRPGIAGLWTAKVLPIKRCEILSSTVRIGDDQPPVGRYLLALLCGYIGYAYDRDQLTNTKRPYWLIRNIDA
jgi:hypothetical protein